MGSIDLTQWVRIGGFAVLLVGFSWYQVSRFRHWLRGPAFYYGRERSPVTPLVVALHRARLGEFVGFGLTYALGLGSLTWLALRPSDPEQVAVPLALAGVSGFAGMLWTSVASRRAYRRGGQQPNTRMDAASAAAGGDTSAHEE